MKTFFVILSVLVAQSSWAASVGTVFQVTRKLRMSQSEPLPPKDFFVDLGEKHGVRPGALLEVSRRVPIIDGLYGGPTATVKVVLGEVRVIWSGESHSIARISMQRMPAEVPTVEAPAIMVGDEAEFKQPLPSE